MRETSVSFVYVLLNKLIRLFAVLQKGLLKNRPIFLQEFTMEKNKSAARVCYLPLKIKVAILMLSYI